MNNDGVLNSFGQGQINHSIHLNPIENLSKSLYFIVWSGRQSGQKSYSVSQA